MLIECCFCVRMPFWFIRGLHLSTPLFSFIFFPLVLYSVPQKPIPEQIVYSVSKAAPGTVALMQVTQAENQDEDWEQIAGEKMGQETLGDHSSKTLHIIGLRQEGH